MQFSSGALNCQILKLGVRKLTLQISLLNSFTKVQKENFSLSSIIAYYVSPSTAIANVAIRSEGCEDPSKHRGCGKAFIWVNGKDYSRHGRGHNVVVLNYKTGKSFICMQLCLG